MRTLWGSLALTLATTALAAWPAFAWAERAGVLALVVAGAVCFVGAAAAHTVAALMRRADPAPQAAPRAVQAAITVRLLATLVLALPLFVLKVLPLAPFAAWLGLHYLGQMVLEVFVSLRALGQNHRPLAAAAADAQAGVGSAGAQGGSPPAHARQDVQADREQARGKSE